MKQRYKEVERKEQKAKEETIGGKRKGAEERKVGIVIMIIINR